MNRARVAHLLQQVRELEQRIAEELGYSRPGNMLRGFERWLDEKEAKKAGFKTVKEWKHHRSKTK